MEGASSYQVAKNVSMVFHVDGSGLHCLDISVHNDISTLQSSFSVYVGRGPYSNLFFIMSCLAVLAATFSFIGISACRPRHSNLLKVGLQIRSIVNGFIRKLTVFKTS
ncbi:unnamed protein product [Lota lota]